MVTTPLTVTAQKIAGHTRVSYEALADFQVFSDYVRIELQRQVIQTENQELLYGTGGARPPRPDTEGKPAKK